MRKLLALIMLMFTTLAFSQKKEIDYPRYEVDSLGQKVVVITVRQAMILDNNSDLLILLKKQVIEMNEYEDICVKVINDKEVVISKMTVQISKLEKDLVVKDDKIKILQDEILALVAKLKLSDEQLANRDDVIKTMNKQMSNLKTKMIIGGIGGGIIIVALVLSSVLH
jgi:hypothetical protein